MKIMIAFTVFGFIFWIGCRPNQAADFVDWDTYLGSPSSDQYSILDDINHTNVSLLREAWRYSTGDADANNSTQIQCNPLIINGILYGTTARLKLFALDASTGREKWVFDPYTTFDIPPVGGVNRGLAFFHKGSKKRLFYTVGSRLFSVNAEDGLPDPAFGQAGTIDLHNGLGRDTKGMSISSTSPGVIYKDLLICGSRVSESTKAAPGHIRAFNVHTGEQVWIFHTIPQPGEFGEDTWPKDAHDKIGGANVWAGFSLDVKRGMVFCPTGSAAYDFYGGDRPGENLFANCILALNALTGERIWHFQTIHHDVWDKDLPAPPNLVTVNKDGKPVPAIAQITKNGFLFVLDRLTGQPLYPVEEIPVEASRLEGENTWPTQPVPTVYPPFSRTVLSEDDLAVRNVEANRFAQHIWSTSQGGHPFIPPSQEGTIIFPGFDGGGEWGGAAYDPVRHDLIVNSNEIPWRAIMDKVTPATRGQSIYQSLCQNCHGISFEGNQIYGNIPTLIDLKKRRTLLDVQTMVKQGKGIMPGFSYLSDDHVEAIYNYINGEEDPSSKMLDPQWTYPYRMRGYEKLYAPDGYPMIRPPWGQLTSIDLDSAQIRWQVPLGEYAGLRALGMPPTGTENYGGPLVTAGNLIFIGATSDEKIRAFEKRRGTVVWEASLPAAGYATPATYAINGKQFIVLACGGGKLGTKSGDTYIAYSLP